MKKLVATVCAAVLLLTLCPIVTEAASTREPGGVPAFFIGCCLGLREGTEWNEGADLHWREWCVLIPYAGIVFAIWNGIDCANGITAREWAEAHGAEWY